MRLSIRRGQESDSEILSSLNADVQRLHAEMMPVRFKPVGPDTFPPDAARALLAKPDNHVFLAEVDGEPAGYVYASIVSVAEGPLVHGWNEVFLHHISVRPQHRRLGIATALLENVRTIAREAGIGLITLQVWSFNEGSQAFFRRHGFSPYMVRLWDAGSLG